MFLLAGEHFYCVRFFSSSFIFTRNPSRTMIMATLSRAVFRERKRLEIPLNSYDLFLPHYPLVYASINTQVAHVAR